MGRGIDQRARVVLAVDFDQRRAEALQRLHADRLVVDEGAGAAVGELHAAQDQRLVGGDARPRQQRARRMARRQPRTSPSPGPARRPGAPAWRRRARRAPARRHRAGSTCRRRSRRSAPTGPTRNRCRAGRSGRCRGSRAGPACAVLPTSGRASAAEGGIACRNACRSAIHIRNLADCRDVHARLKRRA